MKSITIVHLYPRELGINGDVGNVTALAKRAEWRGMPLTVVNHEVGATLPTEVHLVHIGSGPASAQDMVRDDVERVAPTLRQWAAAGVPFLAVAGGWQLLARSIVDIDGTVRDGVGIFPVDIALTSDRTVDEVYGSSDLGDVAGFENHGSTYRVDDGATDLAGGRGVVVGSRIGTNLHGPFLPMNPVWADWLLRAAAERAGVAFGASTERIERADDYAARSRAAVRARVRA